MPFDFLKRHKPDASGAGGGRGAASGAGSAARAARAVHRGVEFEGLTEEWRLVGWMEIPGRLSDALNKREPITIADVRWAPFDGSAELVSAPGLKTIDPYDLIIVLAGEGSLPPLTDAERSAYKVHKMSYDVALEVPPFRVVGTVYLFPGSEPDRLLDRATEMFIPVVDATAYADGRPLTDTDVDAVLVNRFYLRGVEQIDRRTGIKAQTLPGAPLGGTSWQDRSR
ncbi:MAG: hypothetical protein ABIZ30_02730 [Candidatus Limnocylindrales bacterium]